VRSQHNFIKETTAPFAAIERDDPALDRRMIDARATRSNPRLLADRVNPGEAIDDPSDSESIRNRGNLSA
jgi:hypothetical protein